MSYKYQNTDEFTVIPANPGFKVRVQQEGWFQETLIWLDVIAWRIPADLEKRSIPIVCHMNGPLSLTLNHREYYQFILPGQNTEV